MEDVVEAAKAAQIHNRIMLVVLLGVQCSLPTTLYMTKLISFIYTWAHMTTIKVISRRVRDSSWGTRSQTIGGREAKGSHCASDDQKPARNLAG
jgi:hypothetical protein